MALLQLALDLIDIERALAIAKESEKYIDWIEAGTPLIKAEGVECIRKLRKEFPRKIIVADMKIMDTGALEVEIAAKAGANIITVLGAADIGTIRESLTAARKYGAKIMIDVMNVPREKFKEVDALGADYLCVHAGIDMQMRGVSIFDVLKGLSAKTPLAVAGGITKETAGEAAKGAEVIIVGGAITKAANPAKAAKEIKEAIRAKKPFKKKSLPLAELLKNVTASDLSDAMQRKGEMRGLFLVSGKRFFGHAVTVRTLPGDWAKTVEAIDSAEPGSVIVIDACGGKEAVWGELATESAIQRKLAGVVIDGAVRDVPEIRKLNFPVFARYITPTAGEAKGFGEINIEIRCGGALVRPGDLIFGDESGVVVIPHEREIEIINRARDIKEKEERIIEEIRRGSTLGKVLKLKKWELRYK